MGTRSVNGLFRMNGRFIAFDNYSGCKLVSGAVKLNYQWTREETMSVSPPIGDYRWKITDVDK